MQFLSRTNRRRTLAAFAALLVFLLIVTAVGVQFLLKSNSKPDVFVGIDIGYGDANAVYTIANAVSGYANLIIIGSLEVTANTSDLTKVCDYLYQKGFYFIVYVGFAEVGVFPPQGPDSSFFQMAINRWNTKFLGAYVFDEAGGKQLDLPPNNPDRPAPLASNYSDVAIHYTIDLQTYLSLYKNVFYSAPEMKLFTSDYGLYWYDYLSGYDVVFSEFLGSQSQNQLAVSLVRGAAQSQGKHWGAILTFGPIGNSSHIPAYENNNLYDEMFQAWQNKAKYIIVFDAPGTNHSPTTLYGILTAENLKEMKNFWNYIQNQQQSKFGPVHTAYVLPRDYGYGFRSPNDTIWGLWPADTLSPKIWDDTQYLLTTYGLRLDIVYETKTDDISANLQYKTLIFWNDTRIAN